MNFVGCQSDDSNDSSVGGDYNDTKTITKSQAISIAKESSRVQDEIADVYKMKFYYTPDWGTVTATQRSDGSWDVELKGTISGYTDDYKTDFEYDKKFTAKVTVGSSGYVGYVYVTKN